MKIGIGNDHSAVEMKQDIAAYLEEKGYEVVNYGTDSHESCDYPVYGEEGRTCGSGRGCGLWDRDLWYRTWHFPCGEQGTRDPGSRLQRAVHSKTCQTA
mgnify:CR=1 FL=1